MTIPCAALIGAGALFLLSACATPRPAGPRRDPGGPIGTAPLVLAFPPLPSAGPLRFQQQLKGMLPRAVTTVRWVLLFRGDHLTMEVTTTAKDRGRAPEQKTSVTYQGAWHLSHRGLQIQGSTEQEDTGFPRELSLSCLRTVLDVLPAGADLVPGDACEGGGAPAPYWKPGNTRDVAVWHCQLDEEPGRSWTGYQQHGPLAFAAGAGIEWLYVNHDCAGQEGAYRFLPPGPG